MALALALNKLIEQRLIEPETLLTPVAAVSVGVISGEAMLDLCYTEDSHAEVDFNVGHERRRRVYRSTRHAEGAASPLRAAPGRIARSGAFSGLIA